MKYLFIFLSLLTCQHAVAQASKKSTFIVKSGKIWSSKGARYYFDNDARGNEIFSRNYGMNGPVVMLSASEYDSLDRMVRSYWAHSNVGFSLHETVYEGNEVRSYRFMLSPDTAYTLDNQTAESIRSQQDFLSLEAVRALNAGEKRLSHIEVLDSAGRVTTEYYLNDKGDTTSINTYRYDDRGKEVLFHYGTIGSEDWTWDIHSVYDDSANLARSFRTVVKDGLADTTEVYNHVYNARNQKISDNYFYNGKFMNKTDFYYNKQGRLVKELFYENEESTVDVITTYKYKKGRYHQKTERDFRNPKAQQKEVFRVKMKYQEIQ